MSKILRRPMFRGGPVSSYGTGIASGLGYNEGGRVGYKDAGSVSGDISKEEVLFKLLKKSNIDENNFLKGIKDPTIKDKLKSVTQEAHDKDVFGAPTFIINDKIFWGQDRLDFALDEYNK